MNYFIEGIQGAGKSTLVGKLSEMKPDHKVFREGDYNPVELAWCAYVREEKYREILEKYASIRSEIEEKSHAEDDHMGSEKRQRSLRHAHHSPCGAATGELRKESRNRQAH